MACTGAANVHALAIDGTFDDAQAALKEIFGDQEFRMKHRLSAVNSINLARVLAQCVYYLYAWLRLPAASGREAEFVVPTGNFGNVLAGWMLQRMGVPMRGFKVATNQNDILHRLFTTGEYRTGDVRPAWRRRWTSRSRRISSVSSITASAATGAGARDHADLQGNRSIPVREF
jgi:threonine synthase